MFAMYSVVNINSSIREMSDRAIVTVDIVIPKILANGNTQMYQYLFGGLQVTEKTWKDEVIYFLREAAIESTARLNRYLESGRSITTAELAEELFDNGGDECALTLALSGIITLNDLTISGHVINLRGGASAEDVNRAGVIDMINDDEYLLKVWITYASMIF